MGTISFMVLRYFLRREINMRIQIKDRLNKIVEEACNACDSRKGFNFLNAIKEVEQIYEQSGHDQTPFWLIQDKSGCTLLHAAVMLGNVEAVRILLTHPNEKIRIDCRQLAGHRSDHGNTLMHLAGCYASAQGGNANYIQIMKLLNQHGLPYDVRHTDGGTPAHSAAINGGADVLHFLESQKPGLCALPRDDGKTPYDFAKEYKKSAAMAYLQQFVPVPPPRMPLAGASFPSLAPSLMSMIPPSVLMPPPPLLSRQITLPYLTASALTHSSLSTATAALSNSLPLTSASLPRLSSPPRLPSLTIPSSASASTHLSNAASGSGAHGYQPFSFPALSSNSSMAMDPSMSASLMASYEEAKASLFQQMDSSSASFLPTPLSSGATSASESSASAMSLGATYAGLQTQSIPVQINPVPAYIPVTDGQPTGASTDNGMGLFLADDDAKMSLSSDSNSPAFTSPSSSRSRKRKGSPTESNPSMSSGKGAKAKVKAKAKAKTKLEIPIKRPRIPKTGIDADSEMVREDGATTSSSQSFTPMGSMMGTQSSFFSASTGSHSHSASSRKSSEDKGKEKEPKDDKDIKVKQEPIDISTVHPISEDDILKAVKILRSGAAAGTRCGWEINDLIKYFNTGVMPTEPSQKKSSLDHTAHEVKFDTVKLKVEGKEDASQDPFTFIVRSGAKLSGKKTGAHETIPPQEQPYQDKEGNVYPEVSQFDLTSNVYVKTPVRYSQMTTYLQKQAAEKGGVVYGRISAGPLGRSDISVIFSKGEIDYKQQLNNWRKDREFNDVLFLCSRNKEWKAYLLNHSGVYEEQTITADSPYATVLKKAASADMASIGKELRELLRSNHLFKGKYSPDERACLSSHEFAYYATPEKVLYIDPQKYNGIKGTGNPFALQLDGEQGFYNFASSTTKIADGRREFADLCHVAECGWAKLGQNREQSAFITMDEDDQEPGSSLSLKV